MTYRFKGNQCILQVTCKHWHKTSQTGERPGNEDHDGDVLRGHPLVVEERPVHDGKVAVEGDAGEVQDGGRAQGHVHRVINLEKKALLVIGTGRGL